MNTKCPCGKILNFAINKPTRMQHSIARVNCKTCGSKFTVCCEVEADKIGRKYSTQIEADYLSPEAKEATKKKIERQHEQQEKGI